MLKSYMVLVLLLWQGFAFGSGFIKTGTISLYESAFIDANYSGFIASDRAETESFYVDDWMGVNLNAALSSYDLVRKNLRDFETNITANFDSARDASQALRHSRNLIDVVARSEPITFNTNLSAPFFPIGGKRNNFLWTADVNMRAAASFDVIGSPVVFSPEKKRIITDASLRGRSQFHTQLGAGIGRFYNIEEDRRVGIFTRVHLDSLALYQEVRTLHSDNRQKIEQVAFTDYPNFVSREYRFGFDVEMLYEDSGLRLLAGAKDVNAPRFHFNSLNAFCIDAPSRNIEDCLASERLVADGKLSDSGVLTLGPQIYLQGSYQLSRGVTLSSYIDLIPRQTLTGEEERLTQVELSMADPGSFHSGFFIGLGVNHTGLEKKRLTAGVSLYDVLSVSGYISYNGVDGDGLRSFEEYGFFLRFKSPF